MKKISLFILFGVLYSFIELNAQSNWITSNFKTYLSNGLANEYVAESEKRLNMLKGVERENSYYVLTLFKAMSGYDNTRIPICQFNIATSALISIGCKVCQSCSEGICPKGIATQDRMLRRRLDPIRKGQQVANYIEAMTQEVTSLTQQAGNTDIENLERQDLVALTMEASQLTGVPMVRN